MKSFIFFCALPLCLITNISSCWSQKRPATEKPNFILIVADDLGFGDLSMNGSKQIQTPHIDALAETGVNFTQAYVSSAVCAPSRAGFITGINQVEFGFNNNLANNQKGFDKAFLGLPIEQKTIPDLLKPLGYVSGLIGKWHLGYEQQFHPLKRGFDEFWGYTGGGHDYFTSNPNSKRGYKAQIQSNYKTPQKITYLTDDKGDECVSFIERHKDQPFFLLASFNAPHGPLQATEADLKLYAHIKDKRRRTYAAMVHRLDVNIGRIMARVKKQGLSKNTVVVFISDNGGPVYGNASINAPYRGKKGTLLEGGIHVPYIFNWPQNLPKGETYNAPVSSLDIAPTFLALAGGTVNPKKPFTGVNLMPFLLKKNKAKPHEELLWRFTVSASIREGNWKLIRLPDRLPMLFNLATDTSELNNIALKNIEKTKELLKKLGNWDVQLPHPLFLEGPEWRKNQVEQYDKTYPLKQPE